MLRSVADPRKATAYDRAVVKGSTPEGVPAPVAADIIDAQIDLFHTLGVQQLRPGAESDEAYALALAAVREVLLGFDLIANDKESFLSWWAAVVPSVRDDFPEYWTVTRVIRRWPLQDRSRWAHSPCPNCHLKTVKIIPPRHRYALTWFECEKCDWRKNERDDDGLWASAFGIHADTTTKENTTMTEHTETHIDISAALAAGSKLAESAAGDEGRAAAVLLGALPQVCELVAAELERFAKQVRVSFANGDLLSQGVRLAASEVREAAGRMRLGEEERHG